MTRLHGDGARVEIWIWSAGAVAGRRTEKDDPSLPALRLKLSPLAGMPFIIPACYGPFLLENPNETILTGESSGSGIILPAGLPIPSGEETVA
jgi:hypothetical protein